MSYFPEIRIANIMANAVGLAYDATVAAVRDRLPGAFTGGGGVKVGVVDALPAGSATVGKVDQGAPGASAWLADVSDRAGRVLGALAAGSAVIGHVVLDASSAVVGHVLADIGGALDVALSTRAAGTQLPASLVSGRLDVNLGAAPATVPVSAASLPLPAGAGTETTLATRAAASTQTDGTQQSKITDGSRVAAVKAALTAAAAADQALVVSLSPNSPLPTGSRNIGNVGFAHPFIDEAGRLRVSQVTSLGDYKILNSDAQALLMEYNGTGTATTNVNNVSMSVASGQFHIAQSKVYHPYLNGKSQFITITTSGMGAAANVEKSFGYISSDATGTFSTGLDGVRIRKDGSDVYALEVWKSGSLLASIPRSSWTDKLDGTGPSGMTINWANFQVFVIDFLYLGGTAINVAVSSGGDFWPVVTYAHANTTTSTLFDSPNKPIRWEIRSSTGTGSLNVFCAEVATEGFFGEFGQYGNSETTRSAIGGTPLANAGTQYGLIAVRKKTTARDVFTFVETMEGMVGSNDFVQLDLVLNPTFSSGTAFSFAGVSNTPLETAIANTTTPPIYTVGTGVVVCTTLFSQNMNNAKPVRNVLARLGCTLNNTMDTMVLLATPAFSSANVKAVGVLDVKWYT